MEVDLRSWHFSLVIRPEKGPGTLPVSLWATRGHGSERRVFTAPQNSWLEYSRRFEAVGLMDARGLGHSDAFIARGEPIVNQVQCSASDLVTVGFREIPATLLAEKRLDSLFYRSAESSRSGTIASVAAPEIHRGFDWHLGWNRFGIQTRTSNLP